MSGPSTPGVGPSGLGPSAQDDTKRTQKLTPDQQQALKRLHEAATQLEGVFLQMVMDAMDKTVPKDSIFGKESASEETWQSMLSNERAQAIAQSGTLGIAKVLEEQLKSQVLADAPKEAKVQVKGRVEP